MERRVSVRAEHMEENMSLIDDFKSTCVLLDKVTTSDGEGGILTTWKEGAKFIAAITLNSSIEAKIAEKQGVTGIYTVTTGRNVVLQFRDVFKRQYDEKIFRVTSDGDDKFTPPSANLDMRQVSAEEWRLTQ